MSNPIRKIFTSLFDVLFGQRAARSSILPALVVDDPLTMYTTLESLYNNDASLYEWDTTRRLRTVVNRSVEFYASKMIPGDKITTIAKNAQIETAIQTVLETSNFQANKPAMLRHLALYGDQFTRVRGEEDKVMLEDIKPRYVTDFSEDSRGFLQTIRIDIPTVDENGHAILYTEYWDLESYRVWEGHHTTDTEIEQLGEPKEILTLAELGIDFIPIVHTKFKNTGAKRGQSAVYHALDKIYEANRLATRLNDLQFRHNKPIWAALANDKDSEGRPRPAPRIKTSSGDASIDEATKEFLLGDVVSMPGMSRIEPLIPGINYEHALQVLNAQMEELEQDLPELRYYSIQENDQLSGEAIQKLLGAAVDRALEARNNFVSSLKRMNAMALTIGIHIGIFSASLGSFDAGDFQHDIVLDEMFGEGINGRATTLKMLVDATVPLAIAMKKTGFSQEEIDEAVAIQQEERAQMNAALVQNNQNQGGEE
jgi:hypothetical protein